MEVLKIIMLHQSLLVPHAKYFKVTTFFYLTMKEATRQRQVAVQVNSTVSVCGSTSLLFPPLVHPKLQEISKTVVTLRIMKMSKKIGCSNPVESNSKPSGLYCKLL
jgi:hypothetical protein